MQNIMCFVQGKVICLPMALFSVSFKTSLMIVCRTAGRTSEGCRRFPHANFDSGNADGKADKSIAFRAA